MSFGVHRLMLRPRDGHDLRIIDSSLTLSPSAEVRWEFDTFGNSVAFAKFQDSADELVVQSDLVLHRYALDGALVDLAPHAVPYPFAYSDEETIDLAPLLRLECEGEREAVSAWLQQAIPTVPSWSLDALNTLNQAVHNGFAYRWRDEEGFQTPGETLTVGSGTCRDFAFFFMEAARHLGFASRFVTGYLFDPSAEGAGDGGHALSGGGATHAWAETFVPGAGWIEFDPTNSIVAGRNLVRVATTRTPAQAQPVRGTFQGDGVAVLGMEVTVTVRESA